jgi:outer membrane protein assembly factor BamB
MKIEKIINQRIRNGVLMLGFLIAQSIFGQDINLPGSGGTNYGTYTNNSYPAYSPVVYSYPTNATLKWSLAMNYAPFAASLSLAPDGTLYVMQHVFILSAVDASAVDTNDVNYPLPDDFTKWTVRGVSDYYEEVSQTPVIAADGTIYASIGNHLSDYVNHDNKNLSISLPIQVISAINPTNGTVLWDFPVQFFGTDSETFWPQVAAGNDGTIYVTSDNFIYALTNAFGVTNLSFTLGDTNFIFTTTNLFPYSLTNVGVKWIDFNASNYFAGNGYSAPVVGADGTVYEVAQVYPSNGYQLFAFNPTNGAQKWTTSPTFITNYSGATSTPVIGSDGTVYYGAGNCFIAVNPNSAVTNGIIGYKWVYDDSATNSDGQPEDSFSCNPVIGPDGTIYAEVGDGYWYTGGSNELFAINPATGVPKWVINLGIQPFDNREDWKLGSLAVASDGEIYMADGNGTMYSFSPSGTTNWIYQTGNQPLSSPLIGPDGTVYVGSTGTDEDLDYIFAFAGPAPVACSSWAEDGRNARRTAAVAFSQISSPMMTTNGFRFTMTGITNTPICPCATQDFTNWANIGQTVLTGGSINFTDTQSTNFQYRFYRAYPQ